MKRLNLIYWIVTGLFAFFMMLSAIPDIVLEPDAVAIIGDGLGFPNHFIVFLGICKAVGAIAVLIPQFRRIKEWAYAGFFFDLFGAMVAITSVRGVELETFTILVPMAFLWGSYFLWHKKLKEQAA